MKTKQHFYLVATNTDDTLIVRASTQKIAEMKAWRHYFEEYGIARDDLVAYRLTEYMDENEIYGLEVFL